MKPSDLDTYRVPSDAHMSPDGSMAAFTVTTMDLDEDEYVRQIWLWDGSEARAITSGRADMSPRWSPDGATIAFLRKGPADDDKPQVALLPMSGGEAEVITEVENGVSSIAWSPDGTRLAITIADYVDGIEDEEERARAPRRISHPSFRFDNQGWTYDKRSHIHIVDVATREVTRITEGEFSESPPAWSPDGTKLAYLSAAHEEAWTKPRNQVFVVSSEGGEPQARTSLGQWGWSGFGPDGVLYAIGQECEAFTLKPDPFVRIADDSEITVLADLDRNLMPGHPPGILAKPRFLADGTVTCVLEDRGAQTVITIAPDGSTGVLAEGNRLITGFDPTPDGARAFFTATAPRNPGELFVWEGGAEKQLTDFNGEFSTTLIEPHEFTYESNGREVHGWVLLPPGDGKVPVLFNIHGGPATQYGWGFFDEFQVYAAAGYGVVGVNPGGSSGYGYEHVRVAQGTWADEEPEDLVDLMRAPFAAAEQFGRLDTEKMGIMGGSYGGLATAMITAIDDRYRSAVAERGVYNWLSMAGTTDIPFFTEMYLKAEMPDGADTLWKSSALYRAHHIATPTLILHSESDWRCPIEQAQQLFTLLHFQGVDTELVLFPPGEGHELSRSGKPKHRVERFDVILDWHDRYLKQ